MNGKHQIPEGCCATIITNKHNIFKTKQAVAIMVQPVNMINVVNDVTWEHSLQSTILLIFTVLINQSCMVSRTLF